MPLSRLGNTAVAAAVVDCFAFQAQAAVAPLAQWSFDLPSGSNIGDSMGNQVDAVSGFTATPVDGPTYGTLEPITGGTASASLGGTSSLRVADSAALTGHANGGSGFDAFEIDVWIRMNSTAALGQIVRKTGLAGDNNIGFELFHQAGGRLGFGLRDGTVNAAFTTPTATPVINANAWHHVQVTWDGSDVDLFVDGVNAGGFAYAGNFPDTDIDMGIGALIRANGTIGQRLDGSIDSLVIRASPVPEPASLAMIAAAAALGVRPRVRPR